MRVKTRPLTEITHRAIEVLCRELGAVDAIRFINQFSTGQGDYTMERDVPLVEETLDQIIADIKKRRTVDGLATEGNELVDGH
jgi:hypothetical protein